MNAPSSLNGQIPSIYKMECVSRSAPQPAAKENQPSTSNEAAGCEGLFRTADATVVEQTRDVAVLPAFDPAVGAVMVMAGISLSMGGSGPSGAAIHPALTGTLGDQHADIRYSLTQYGMTSLGSLRPTQAPDAPLDNNVWEHMTASSDHSARLSGRIGDKLEDLTVSTGAGGVHVEGKIGAVPVNVTYGLSSSQSERKDGEYPWANVSGTIGAVDLNADAMLGPPSGTDLASIRIQGFLGPDEITKSYRVIADPDSHVVTIEGQGTVAGIPQEMRLVLDLSQATQSGGQLPLLFEPHG